MKKILFLLFFYVNSLNAIEVACLFEEVYSDGQVQQGYFLIKDKKLRYRYNDIDLFTVILNKDRFYLIQNNNHKLVQSLEQNTDLLKSLIDISSDFPNIKEIYFLNNSVIKLEKSNLNFIRRASIQSDKINLSINTIDCSFKTINDKYFKPFDLHEYKEKF